MQIKVALTGSGPCRLSREVLEAVMTELALELPPRWMMRRCPGRP